MPDIPPPTSEPWSEESERATLAACLLQPELVPQIAERLQPADFYLDRHQHIFAAMLTVTADPAQVIDLRTLQAELEDRRVFDSCGGLAYLATLDSHLPDLSHAGQYVEIVRERARRRQLIEHAHRLVRSAYDGGVPAADLANRARVIFERLETDTAHPDSGTALVEVAEDSIEIWATRRQERQETGKVVTGFATGLPVLDRVLGGGLQQGFYLLAGPPGKGKTTLALQLAAHVAEHSSRPVLYVSFENSRQNLLRKLLCARAGVELRRLEAGGMGEGQAADLVRVNEHLAQTVYPRLEIVDGTSALTTGQLRGMLRRASLNAGEPKPGQPGALLVLDYLQLYAKASREFAAMREVRGKVDALVAELIALGKSFGGPVLALSSQSRSGGDYGNEGKGSASLASAKESGDIEYASDGAFFLVEPGGEGARQATAPDLALDLVIAKNRHGPAPEKVPLIFQRSKGVFVSVDTRY